MNTRDLEQSFSALFARTFDAQMQASGPGRARPRGSFPVDRGAASVTCNIWVDEDVYEERFQGTPAGTISKTEYKLAAEYAHRCEYALC